MADSPGAADCLRLSGMDRGLGVSALSPPMSMMAVCAGGAGKLARKSSFFRRILLYSLGDFGNPGACGLCGL